MTFDLSIPALDGRVENLTLSAGHTIFTLGANGAGKSALMQRFAQYTSGRSKKIAAHRQMWLQSNSPTFTSAQKPSYEQQLNHFDRNPQSRWQEQNPGIRPSLTIYDLIDAENVEARAIAGEVRSGNLDAAARLARRAAPLVAINELLACSNIPIAISLQVGDQLMASRNGGAPYSAAELSDGERNVLLIAAEVLTARPGTLLLIDEPERHLHRAIISPLLTQLFSMRRDCAFVVATHDLMLPMDNPDARVLLIRGCSFSGQQAVSWQLDVLEPGALIDDALKQDILGARRTIVFVEGEGSSLDQPLYSLLFPGASVRPKGSCRAVEQAVAGLRATSDLSWVSAWGVVDGDGRGAVETARLQDQGIYAIPFYSVE